MAVGTLLIVIALILAIIAACGVGAKYPLLAASVILICVAILFGGGGLPALR